MDTGRLDGNALRTERTRARILAESQRLFNERGVARVTTGMIAASLDMSPGNLYYHFRNKDAIVEQLLRRFEERIDVEPGRARDAAAAIEDLWLYLHLMLEAIRDYRFIYRDLDDLLGRDRRLRAHFHRGIERKAATVVALCEALVRARAMRADAPPRSPRSPPTSWWWQPTGSASNRCVACRRQARRARSDKGHSR